MVTVQAQSSSIFPAGSAPGRPLPSQEQQRHSLAHRHRPELQSLPVARDSHGRSSFLVSLQSPRPLSSKSAPSAKPTSSSPVGHLLESLTPRRIARQASTSARCQARAPGVTELPPDEKREDVIPHLETCLQMTPPKSGSLTGDILTGAAISTRGGSRLAALACGSIVACAGSPTAIRAVRREFPDASIASKYSEAEAVLQAVEDRTAHRALLAVESTMQGTVHRTYDLLLRHNVHVVGELVESSCSVDDQEEIVNRKRFWVVSRDVCTLPRDEASFKTVVALVLREGLGALHKALAAFAMRDIPITKLESRPWRAEPLIFGCSSAAVQHSKAYFQYVLFIEFQSSTASRAAQNALAQLQQLCSFLRLLGSYPSFHATTMDVLGSTSLNQPPRPFQIAPPSPVLVAS